MQNVYKYYIANPIFESLGYLAAVANIQDKHDRSAPSDYHWKILKCRMIIFSNSSILACPDKNDIKQVHIVFNKMSDDHQKLTMLFQKFSLVQGTEVTIPTPEMYQMCFTYTITAKLAPTWNIIGINYLINNRDFLKNTGPQDGIKYNIHSNDICTTVEVKPIKINFIKSDDMYCPGEWIRVLPSLNKATIEDYYETLPESGTFKSYKDLRRHWKNIHGYRLPDDEGTYYSVRFWRGDPLTYPKICIVRNFPTITPVPKPTEKIILTKFISCLKSRVSHILGMPLTFMSLNEDGCSDGHAHKSLSETQAISLCTPTQIN